ncbi:MAG: transposase [Actinobacteria bacterium]|nr:transposase [Actinomycetota bacterium]
MGRRSKFTPAQKKDAVLGVLSRRKSMAEVCRELGVTETTLMRWRESALEAIEEALHDKTNRDATEADLARRLAEAERTIGRLALENELLGKASRWLT